jgi:hypothetical protein
MMPTITVMTTCVAYARGVMPTERGSRVRRHRTQRDREQSVPRTHGTQGYDELFFYEE